MSARPFKDWLALVARGRTLAEAEAEAAVEAMIAGAATAAEIGGFLMALRQRGESVDEIVGAARALRRRMIAIEAPPGAIDICGTGGDHRHSLNISTAAAFVVAGAGVPVAKHGNRAVSSRSGSADVLAALGLDLEAPPVRLEQALREANIAFLMAPRHHPAMAAVAEARRDLGVRTLFNLLGPLANPAGVRRQVIGVFAETWLEPMAEAARQLGSAGAWVVHGDGFDEIATTGATGVVALEEGEIRRFSVTPAALGLGPASAAELTGGAPEENAAALRRLLDGEAGAYRDVVLVNAAAALVVAGAAADLATGLRRAAESIDSGAAAGALARLIEIAGLAV